jgi:hypothetical protein
MLTGQRELTRASLFVHQEDPDFFVAVFDRLLAGDREKAKAQKWRLAGLKVNELDGSGDRFSLAAERKGHGPRAWRWGRRWQVNSDTADRQIDEHPLNGTAVRQSELNR